jgi:hypothetical protein
VFCYQWQEKNLIFVPQKLRRRIYDQLHGISHPGGRASIRIIKRTYYWPKMEQEIRDWVRKCDSCQRSKISRHTKSQLEQYPQVNRFETVHTNIIHLPKVDGYKYAVSFIDCTTRWVESVPLKSIEVTDVAEAFVDAWVSRHGVPTQLISDCGPQYHSRLFEEICALLGVNTV